MNKRLRIIVWGNAIIVACAATYFLIIPTGLLVHALNDPGLRSGEIPRFAFHWHRSLSERIEPWARQRVASGRAAKLSLQNVSGTEWPVFGSVFYLWATEALQQACDRDPSLAALKPAQYARGAIDAVAALVADPNHATWVKQYWGNDYLRHDNLFYRMLLISGLTSYQKLSKDNSYETALRDQVTGLSHEIDQSSFGLLDDYPGQCYPVDVLAAVAAIRKTDEVLGSDHSIFVDRALRGFEEARLDSETQLPAWRSGSKTGIGLGSARGVGLAFMLCWAPQLWPETGRDWYARFTEQFWKRDRLLAGFREFPRKDPIATNWMYDVDSGPILAGYGTAASAFGIGAARANGHFDHAYPLSVQALVASWLLPDGSLLFPRLLSNLSDAPFTGESALLFSFTRLPTTQSAAETVQSAPGAVYLALALAAGFAFLCLAGTAQRVKRWETETWHSRVPALSLQCGIWLIVVAGGLTAMFSRPLIAAILLCVAQLLPGITRRGNISVPLMSDDTAD